MIGEKQWLEYISDESCIAQSCQSEFYRYYFFLQNRNSQALVQIKLCLSKAFKPISCHSSKQLSDFVPKWESTRYNPRLRLCTTSFGVKYMTLDDIHKHS